MEVETSHDGNWIAWGSTSGTTINGTDGNDLIDSGGGSDTIDGGAGNDTLLLFADRSTFNITVNGDTITLTGNSLTGLAGAYWADTITMTNVETIWFADQIVSVSELASSSASARAFDNSDDDSDNPASNADEDISVIPPDGDCRPASNDNDQTQSSPGIVKGDDFGCRTREDDLPNLWAEADNLGDLMLPETVAELDDLPKPDLSLLAGLVSDDTESWVMAFEPMAADNVISASIENIKAFESDPISQTDLIIDTDWNPIQEELLYISELG
jgi:hypothetical protein